MDLHSICKEVIILSKEAGSYLLSQKELIGADDILEKGAHDFVTYVDKTCERMIVDRLAAILPEAGFIAEEGTSSKKGEVYNWIVDPLDGTTNFIHGLSPFCTSIALQENEEIIVGIIYDPSLDECFYAWKDGGAFLNEKPIRVSPTDNLDTALLATGFPYSDYSLLDNYINLFKWVMLNTQGVRRLGSAAIDLAYVACGRMDGFFEYGLKPWDVAAGALIVKEAGGKVGDFSQTNTWLLGGEILATNDSIFMPFIDVIKEYFKDNSGK